MEIVVQHETKIVEVWMTKAEQLDAGIQSRLKPLYAAWKAKKYLVAVFHSGEKNLSACTSALLLHNQTVAAQQELAQGKEAVSCWDTASFSG